MFGLIFGKNSTKSFLILMLIVFGISSNASGKKYVVDYSEGDLMNIQKFAVEKVREGKYFRAYKAMEKVPSHQSMNLNKNRNLIKALWRWDQNPTHSKLNDISKHGIAKQELYTVVCSDVLTGHYYKSFEWCIDNSVSFRDLLINYIQSIHAELQVDDLDFYGHPIIKEYLNLSEVDSISIEKLRRRVMAVAATQACSLIEHRSARCRFPSDSLSQLIIKIVESRPPKY